MYRMKRSIAQNTRLTVGLIGVFLAIVIVLPSQIAGQCPQWDASGIWNLNQSNKISVKMVLNQRGPRLNGNAYFQGKTGMEHGTVSGTIQGDVFHVDIKWDYGETGIYNGKRIEVRAPADKLQYLAGDAYIKEQPDNKSRRSTWRSSSAMHCYQGRSARP